MLDIKKLSKQDLKQKIDNIKAEHEKTENALKRYEEELERRNKEVPLGVPLENRIPDAIFDDYKFAFSSEESRLAFGVRLKEYVEALQKLAKGEQIDIKVLLPLLRKGWVAMDQNSHWYWYENKPKQCLDGWGAAHNFSYLLAFNLKPAEDWRNSLIECGL